MKTEPGKKKTTEREKERENHTTTYNRWINRRDKDEEEAAKKRKRNTEKGKKERKKQQPQQLQQPQYHNTSVWNLSCRCGAYTGTYHRTRIGMPIRSDAVAAAAIHQSASEQVEWASERLSAEQQIPAHTHAECFGQSQ